MLRRISELVDPELVTEILLRPLLEAAPRTGLGLPTVSVGRHPSNDVVLQSSGIPLLLSRFHSAITFDGEQYTLVDKTNTNGTYVRASPTAQWPPPRTGHAPGQAHVSPGIPASRDVARADATEAPSCCVPPWPPQVNSVQLPHLGRRILHFGDTVSFGGPENVRVSAPGAGDARLGGARGPRARSGAAALCAAARVGWPYARPRWWDTSTRLCSRTDLTAGLCGTRLVPTVPVQVLREGVSLRNPFRFVFEECPSQAGVAAGEPGGAEQQPVRGWRDAQARAPELATHTPPLPSGAACGRERAGAAARRRAR